MELLHNAEDIIILLHDESGKGEFEINLKDTIKIEQKYQCALVDINLPDMIIDKHIEGTSIYVHLLWKSLNIASLKPDADKKYYDKETTQRYATKFNKKFPVQGKLRTPEEITTAINNVISHPSTIKFIEDSYKTRFGEASLKIDQNLILPRISFDNGKFKNVQGGIRFTGLHLNKYSELSLEVSKGRTQAAPMADIYKQFKNAFYKHKVAYLYITFDKILHNYLGFDIGVFPNILPFFDPSKGNVLIQNQEGFADKRFIYKPEITHIQTNIIEDIQYGDKKKKILQIIKPLNESDKLVHYYHFNHLMFIPLRVNEIHSIRVLISDSKDNTIVYDQGFISMTLKLTPIKNEF